MSSKSTYFLKAWTLACGATEGAGTCKKWKLGMAGPPGNPSALGRITVEARESRVQGFS